jgi:hypothetical protein
MVMSALAWNLKAWYELLMPNRERGPELLRMEFRRFQHLIVMLPAQIVRSGRRIIYRIMVTTIGSNQRLLCYLGVSSPNGTCLVTIYAFQTERYEAPSVEFCLDEQQIGTLEIN